tara:strand:+ start:794 stop:913 length:120 start_codon:yes stop_codon:yes gene_type:complete
MSLESGLSALVVEQGITTFEKLTELFLSMEKKVEKAFQV